MQSDSAGDTDRPATSNLMAAVIRLMAQCSTRCDLMQIRTLLRLLRALRDHPDLPRQPAVLAGLAAAHSIWVERLAQLGDATGGTAGSIDGESGPQLR